MLPPKTYLLDKNYSENFIKKEIVYFVVFVVLICFRYMYTSYCFVEATFSFYLHSCSSFLPC